jgi:hypothetical protein
MVKPRTEVAHIRREQDRHAMRVGDTVVYFEMEDFGDDPDLDSTYHHVYDEPAIGVGGRLFKGGVPIRTVGQVVETEDARRHIPDGRQTAQTIRFTVNYQTMVDAGVEEPWESPRHLKDMVYFDGRYYQIYDYRIIGRVQDEISVVIAGNESFLDQDLVNSPGPTLPGHTTYPWPSTFPPKPGATS